MKAISNDFRMSNIEPSPHSFSAQGSLGSTISRNMTPFQAMRSHCDKKERLGTILIQIKRAGDFEEIRQK